MTSDLARMIQHAVPSSTMTDSADLEQRLRSLVNDVNAAKERQRAADREVHDLVIERNDVMRELAHQYGVHPKRLRELAELASLPLAYRIVAGEDR